MNPRPGASLGEAIGRSFQQIVPDFLVDTYDDGTINISLNNRNVPELRMSRDFTEMVEEHTKNKANQSKESKEAMMFLKQKMDAAYEEMGGWQIAKESIDAELLINAFQ